MSPPRLVIISGFTAAGKTTHARLLAQALGWNYIGISQLRKSQIPDLLSAATEWCPELDDLRVGDAEIDLEIDRKMKAIIEGTHTPLVVDAWLQPWLCDSTEACRIWLNSDFDSRIKKAQVSRLRAGLHQSPKIEAEIVEKDRFSVEVFHRIYGIDFGPDPEVFDLFLDNSTFIAEASINASDQGIENFSLIFNSAVSGQIKAAFDAA